MTRHLFFSLLIMLLNSSIQSTIPSTIFVTNDTPFPLQSIVRFVSCTQAGECCTQKVILASGQKHSFSDRGLPLDMHVTIIKNLSDASFYPLLGKSKSKIDEKIEDIHGHFWIMYDSRHKKIKTVVFKRN
jgi:hypothetical protein